MPNTTELRPIKFETGLHDDELLPDLLERFGIEHWDWLLIGDGSGLKHTNTAGWGCVAVHRRTFRRYAFWGVMNCGTVNFAEIMAYLQPLSFIAAEEAAARPKGQHQAIRDVHIITDSQYCAQQGQRNVGAAKCNASLWQVFSAYERNGLALHWHHAPRTDVALNLYADALSKAARQLAVVHDAVRQVDRRDGDEILNAYHYNPIG